MPRQIHNDLIGFSRNEAITRIKMMRLRPQMWAVTREGLFLQVSILLEICGLTRNEALNWEQSVHPQSEGDWHPEAYVDNDYAEIVCLSALMAIPE